MVLMFAIGQMWAADETYGNGRVMYLDISNASSICEGGDAGWKCSQNSLSYKIRMWYNDTDNSYDIIDDYCGTRIGESDVYYVTTDNDYVRFVQAWRSAGECGDNYNYSNKVGCADRAVNSNNCIYLKEENKNWWNTWVPGWKTYAPPMSSVALTDNGTATVGGTGKSTDPYLVYVGATIKVAASGEKAVADNDATINYDFKEGETSKQNGESATYEFKASETENTVYTINLDGYTKISTTASEVKAAEALYYKTIALPAEAYVTLDATKTSDINVGETITLTAEAHNTTATNFEFFEGEVSKQSSASASFTYTPTTVGNKTIKVVMTYAEGTKDASLNLVLNTPSVALAIKDGSSSEIYLGETTATLVATPSHVGAGVTPSYVFTDQAETPVTSEAQTETEWTYVPVELGEKTMKVTMTVGGETYTATTIVKVYKHWNIFVHDVQGWGGLTVYSYSEEAHGGWHGTACDPVEEGSTWYTVTLNSKGSMFILNDGGSKQTINLTSADYEANSYWYLKLENDEYSLGAASLSDPTVVIDKFTVVNTNQILVTGNIENAGGDGVNAADMKEVGFYVGETKYVATCTDATYFWCYITGLSAGTKYAVEAYAENIHGVGKSDPTDITTRAAGTTTIKVRRSKTDPAPKIFAFTATETSCGGELVYNEAYPGEAMTQLIAGNTYVWYTYELSNEFNQFLVAQGDDDAGCDKTKSANIDNPFEAKCYWYDPEAAEDSRIGEMACPYLEPQLMIGNVPGATDDVAYLEMAATSELKLTKTVSLLAKSSYKFKVVFNTEWYGIDGEDDAVTRDKNSKEGLSETKEKDLWVVTDAEGDYTFIFDPVNKSIEVTYPEAYVVTFAIGAIVGTEGAISVSPSIESGDYVPVGSELTFTRPAASLGYKFSGWYNNGNGSGTALGTDASYEATINGTTSIYAVYVVDGGGTGVENAEAGVKAVKSIENGMLIIEKNGVKYNAQGQVIK